MKPRHTPGPWTAEEYGNSSADGSQPWGVFAKDTDPDARPGDRIMLAECLTEADARLIAEAPAILETHKLAYRCCRVVHGEQSELCRTIQRTIAAVEQVPLTKIAWPSHEEQPMFDLSSRLMRDACRQLLVARLPRKPRRWIVRARRTDGTIDVLAAANSLEEAEAVCKRPWVGYTAFSVSQPEEWPTK